MALKSYSMNGRERPAEPPSLFGDIPVPNKLSFEVKNSVQDEMETFEDADKVQYQDLQEKLTEDENIFHVPTVSFISEGVLYCQAKSFYGDGVARFLVAVNSDLSF